MIENLYWEENLGAHGGDLVIHFSSRNRLAGSFDRYPVLKRGNTFEKRKHLAYFSELHC
jgi:hypothetical protein